MSDSSNVLVPGLALTREQALALPGMRRYRLVEFLVRWEHFGAARELLESLVTQKAGRFFYQYRLAQCCLATGDMERAKQLARGLFASDSTRAVGLLAIGDVFYVEGRLARAEEHYRQAIEVEKTRESAQRRLAWCLLHRRNMEGAAELAEHLAAGKRPGQLVPAAVRLLAAVAMAGGRADQAAALRQELKSRWKQELDRLRTSLELAEAEQEVGFAEQAGLTPAATEFNTERGSRALAAERTAAGAGPRERHGETRSELEGETSTLNDAPVRKGGALSAPPPITQPLNTQPPASGYVYPTPRERRAAAEAAARAEAARFPIAARSLASPAAPPAPEAAAAGVTEPPRPAKSDVHAEPGVQGFGCSGGIHRDEQDEQDGRARGLRRPGPGTPPLAPRTIHPPVHPDHPVHPVNAEAGPEHLNTEHPAPADSGALRAALKDLFGYDQFRPGQEEVVRLVLEGRSVLATMPTGRGKSLCFQLPALLLPPTTVVISPLIALMQDQLEGLPPRLRQRAAVLNSSLETAQLEQRLRELAAGRYALVYAAPERLRQRPFLHALSRAGVSLLVVDEAHCISLWGQDFRPDYLFLPKVLQELGRPPLLAMTATATSAMQQDIRSQFGVPMEAVSQGVFRPNLALEVQRCPNKSAKLKALREICGSTMGAIIVYVNSRARTEHLSQALNEAGVSAGFYHAGLPAELREATQQRFMRDELRCLVATVAFGMGIDKPDIRLIVHHDLPRSLEGYYQEAGRAGRDGAPARCILFASPGDKANLSRWARQDRITPGDVHRLHRALTGMVRSLTLNPDDLERETGLDETHVRVGISVLERVGALRRQYDLPRVCNLQAAAAGDGSFARFVAAAQLRPRQRVSRDTDELCALSGIPPDAIEPCLLDWAEAGWLEYRGSARGLRLEPLAVPDLEARIKEILRAMEAVDEARLARLEEYVRASTCRHQFLSNYFGHPLRLPSPADGLARRADCCGECDNCRGNVASGRRQPGTAGRA